MTAGIRKASARPPWRVTSGRTGPGTVDRLLRLLPGWFGIESSIIEYVAKAQELPTYLAWPGRGSSRPGRGRRQPHGGATSWRLATFRERAAEIYLMAVEPAVHRLGIGRAPRAGAGGDLAADRRAAAPEVKTLGPSRPDAGYDPDATVLRVHGLPACWRRSSDLWPENAKCLDHGQSPPACSRPIAAWLRAALRTGHGADRYAGTPFEVASGRILTMQLEAGSGHGRWRQGWQTGWRCGRPWLGGLPWIKCGFQLSDY